MDGPHAGATDAVDHDPGPPQLVDDADVRQPARAAAGQHDADRLACEPAGQAGDVVGGQVGADQVVRHGVGPAPRLS